MSLIKGYWLSNGKKPICKEENRILYQEPPEAHDYVAVYKENKIVRIDIDDYSHKTGTIDGPIRGKPRSEAILRYLDDKDYKYNAIKTEHGVHIIMLLPETLEIEKNKPNWYCAIGVKLEAHVTKVFEPMRVNGIERCFIKGSFDNEDIDCLPSTLIPIQKGKNKGFLMNFEEGDRNNHLSEYAFHLSNLGLPADHIKEVIETLNNYIMESPLPSSEIDTILRPETMEKLRETEEKVKNGTVSPETFKMFLKSLGMTIKYNELLNVVEYENIPDTPDYQDITDIQNVMPIKLQYEFRKFTGKQNITKHHITDLILLEADTHTYNPVKEFLKSTEWDKIDRFPQVFDILGITNELQQTFIRKWFYQTAGTPFNTIDKPFQAEGVLILQGDEGIGKTRFFQQIAVNPLWFSSLDKELTTKNKDILIQILSVWIAEIGEIDRTFKANKSDVKSFITSRDDTIRKPYRSEQVKKARTTSFCGTTNKDTFLSDDTGSRRWWVIPVKKRIILDDFIEEDNLKQFWAQCYYNYSQNPDCFRLTEDEKSQLKKINRESMELLPSEEELRNRFDFDAPKEKWNWTTSSALRNLHDYDVERYSAVQIGKALTSIVQDGIGVIKRRSKGKNQYFIPPAIIYTDRFRNKTD